GRRWPARSTALHHRCRAGRSAARLPDRPGGVGSLSGRRRGVLHVVVALVSGDAGTTVATETTLAVNPRRWNVASVNPWDGRRSPRASCCSTHRAVVHATVGWFLTAGGGR